jgi:hypothetical protein
MIVEIILIVGDENRAVRRCILSDEYGEAIVTGFILRETHGEADYDDEYNREEFFHSSFFISLQMMFEGSGYVFTIGGGVILLLAL